MFGFIKNLVSQKTFKEAKQEYKQAKANYIAKVEELENIENMWKANAIISDILDLCFSALRPDQDDCPTLIIYNYKRLLELGDDDALVRTTNMLGMYLSETQQQDFMNKTSQLKEYKVWKSKKKMKELEKDFI